MTPASTTTCLNSLPPELILQIAKALGPAVHNLSSLQRTNRRFAVLLSPILVQRGVRARDQRTGRSVLHWAAATGRDSLLLALIGHGADVDSVDHRGNAPLHSAVLNASTVAVRKLLAHGADVERRNMYGWAALDLAAITGHCDITGVLLEYGAQIVACSGALLGSTPFHYAVMQGHAGVAQMFLAHGAEAAATDRAGITVAKKAAIACHGDGQAAISVLLFGTAEGASSLVACDEVAPFVRLVGIEIRGVRMDMAVLVAVEKRAARFCTIPVATVGVRARDRCMMS